MVLFFPRVLECITVISPGGGGPFLLGFYIDYLFIIILVIFLSYGFLFSY